MTQNKSRTLEEGNGEIPTDQDTSKTKRHRVSQLLEMSHALKRTLEPVEVRASFMKTLNSQLSSNVENARLIIERRTKRRRQFKWTVIGAGSAVYLVSAGIAVARITRWGIKRIRKSAS